MSNKNKGGGTKKYGRKRQQCQAYRMRGLRELNKRRRQIRHWVRVWRKALKHLHARAPWVTEERLKRAQLNVKRAKSHLKTLGVKV